MLTFPPNPANRGIELLIQTPVSGRDVVVNIASQGVEPPINLREVVSSTSPTSIVLPSSLRPSTGTGVEEKSVVVTASDVITVTVLAQGSCSAFLSLPVESAGTEYYGTTWWSDDSGAQGASHILVTAVKVPTDVSVTLPFNPGMKILYKGVQYIGGDTITEHLETYQSFKLEGKFDLTGTHITSGQPVSVFSGNIRVKIGENSLPDTTMEQLPPTSTWGHSFVILPVSRSQTGSFVKFVSRFKNTTVEIPGLGSYFLAYSGDFTTVELEAETFATLEADRPIQVVYFTKGDSIRPAFGAPSALVLPPVEQYLNSFSFKTVASEQKTFSSSLFIVAKRSDTAGVVLGGNSNNIVWTPVPGSEYVGGHVRLTGDTNILFHRDKNVKLMGYVHGFSLDDCAFSFPAGMDIKVRYGENSYPFLKKQATNQIWSAGVFREPRAKGWVIQPN